MPDSKPGHAEDHAEEEGWGVHEAAGFGLAAALYALAFLGCGVAAVMFALYFPAHAQRPWPEPFPEPRLNGRIDRDPGFSYGPKPVAAAAVDPAMRAEAGQGDAGWDPQAGSARGGGGRP